MKLDELRNKQKEETEETRFIKNALEQKLRVLFYSTYVFIFRRVIVKHMTSSSSC